MSDSQPLLFALWPMGTQFGLQQSASFNPTASPLNLDSSSNSESRNLVSSPNSEPRNVGFSSGSKPPDLESSSSSDSRNLDPAGTAGSEPPPLSSLTSLDPDETNVRFHQASVSLEGAKESERLCVSFRHSFWRRRRETVYRSLLRLREPESVISRFRSCGSSSWVFMDADDPDRLKIATNACRCRFCEACAREKRSTIVRNVATVLDGRSLRLLTLTLKSTDAPLSDQLDRIYSCFRAFRASAKIKPVMRGGLSFLELTYSPLRRQWHPHLHILFEGDYLPHAVAKAVWFAVTGDSYIVDIRGLGSSKAAASYVSKYATKSISAYIWTQPGLLDLVYAAMRSRRTFATFGCFRGLALSKAPADDTDWLLVEALDSIILKARSGDPRASAILSTLTHRAPEEPLDIPPDVEDTS